MYGSQVYPDIFQWATYGVTSLIERIYEQNIRPSIGKEVPPSPYWVEIMAVLERVLNYAHTGNARVLSRALLGPMWPYYSLPDTGFPAFSRLLTITPDAAQVNVVNWPRDEDTKVPATASSRSALLTYGKALADVSVPLMYLLTPTITVQNGPHPRGTVVDPADCRS